MCNCRVKDGRLQMNICVSDNAREGSDNLNDRLLGLQNRGSGVPGAWSVEGITKNTWVL
jgi:hypothetical protein